MNKSQGINWKKKLTKLMRYMKKLLNSDCLRYMQF